MWCSLEQSSHDNNGDYFPPKKTAHPEMLYCHFYIYSSYKTTRKVRTSTPLIVASNCSDPSTWQVSGHSLTDRRILPFLLKLIRSNKKKKKPQHTLFTLPRNQKILRPRDFPVMENLLTVTEWWHPRVSNKHCHTESSTVSMIRFSPR